MRDKSIYTLFPHGMPHMSWSYADSLTPNIFMKNFIERIITSWLIKKLEIGYGTYCTGEEPLCVSCQAHNAIIFLKEHVSLLKWENSR